MNNHSTPSLTARIDQMLSSQTSKIKAIASVIIGNVYVVHGIKVIETESGPCVFMPSYKHEIDGKTEYTDTFHALSSQARAELINAVLKAYEERLHMDE